MENGGKTAAPTSGVVIRVAHSRSLAITAALTRLLAVVSNMWVLMGVGVGGWVGVWVYICMKLHMY